MSFPSEQEHFDAVKAALVAANAKPYDYDETPPNSVSWYSLLTVSDRFGGTQRLTGQIGTRSVRVTVRAVGRTIENAREVRRRFDAALREQILTVGDFATTPIAFETAESITQDGDVPVTKSWWSGLTTYTYVV